MLNADACRYVSSISLDHLQNLKVLQTSREKNIIDLISNPSPFIFIMQRDTDTTNTIRVENLKDFIC